jgi:hypothetical protein
LTPTFYYDMKDKDINLFGSLFRYEGGKSEQAEA